MPNTAARARLGRAVSSLDLWLRGQAGNVPYKATPEGIDAMVQGYVDDLTRDFLDVLDGHRSVPKSERGHRGYVEQLAEPAYDAGMTDGGADPADKDDTDEAAINDWVSTQEQAIGGLWDDIKQLRTDEIHSHGQMSKDEYAARQLTINDRIALWGQSLRLLYADAKARAQKDAVVHWVLGEAEHCEDCLAYAELKPHRMSWWQDQGRMPQSRDLACHGFNCACSLQNRDGDVLYP